MIYGHVIGRPGDGCFCCGESASRKPVMARKFARRVVRELRQAGGAAAAAASGLLRQQHGRAGAAGSLARAAVAGVRHLE